MSRENKLQPGNIQELLWGIEKLGNEAQIYTLSRSSRGDQRKQTIQHYLIVNEEEINVCRLLFLNTLGILETVVRTFIKRQIRSSFAQADMRGQHTPANVLSEKVFNGMRPEKSI